MSLRPLIDKCKIQVSETGYMGSSNASGRDSGILKEVPSAEQILFFGFHSFAFDQSLGSVSIAERINKFYSSLIGKTVYWEALQDKGRRFKEDGNEFIVLNLSDIIAYDDVNGATAKMIDDVRSGGFQVGAA